MYKTHAKALKIVFIQVRQKQEPIICLKADKEILYITMSFIQNYTVELQWLEHLWDYEMCSRQE